MGFRKTENYKNDDRIFLDRNDIFNMLEEDIIAYTNADIFYMLYAFFGMGGIGKSRLVHRIYDLYKNGILEVYMIPLEILNHETIPSILLYIRKLFSYTPHFDYVLFRYWEFINYDRIDRKSLYNIVKKSGIDVVETIDNIIFNGIAHLKSGADFLIKLYEEREVSEQEREYVTDLLLGKSEDLYQYMVQSLAKDIERELYDNKYLFIFDAYNICEISTEYDWLCDFVNAFQKGLFIITSRESLRWFNDSDVDQALYKNIPLESIPAKVVENYLSEQGYSNTQICIIKEKTDCIPLFLDIILKSYKKEEINRDTFVGFKDKKDLVKWFLSHLSKEEQNIIEYLAVIKLFNEEVYDNVLDFNKLSCQQYGFENFEQSTIVRYIEKFNGLYKIHSILAHNITLLMKKELCHKIIKNYIQFTWARILNDFSMYDDIKYNFIINIYTLVIDQQMSITEKISEQLLDMYFYLYDRSYERDFTKYISEIQNIEKSSLKDIYKYISGKSVRLSNISKGLKILESIPMNECAFGKHKKMLQCDMNYLLSILGQYDKAEIKMQEFARNLDRNERNQRYYAKGIIFDCDMKMLRGKFRSAVSGLLDLENDMVDNSILFEIQKAIGHIYRFNFLMEDAIKHYSKYDTFEKKSYYYTVYCETYCYSSPHLVFDIYEDAKKENQKYNNHNNLGKIYYAMAIAYILEADYILAKKYIKKSTDEFKKTKYRAGLIFVMITQAYLEYSQTQNISMSTVKKIINYIRELDNIYEYLLLPIYVARKDIAKIEEYKYKFEWFSFEETVQKIEKFIIRLQV